MLTIIEINVGSNGAHGLQSQSDRTECWLDGWIAVPKDLEDKVWETLGWCDLQIEDGILIDVIPREKPTSDPELFPESGPSDTEVLNTLLGVTAE